MSDEYRELIEQAREHYQSPIAPWCFRCALDWPCLTARLADALEQEMAEHRSCATFLEDAQIQLPLAQEDLERASARAERLVMWVMELEHSWECGYRVGFAGVGVTDGAEMAACDCDVADALGLAGVEDADA